MNTSDLKDSEHWQDCSSDIHSYLCKLFQLVAVTWCSIGGPLSGTHSYSAYSSSSSPVSLLFSKELAWWLSQDLTKVHLNHIARWTRKKLKLCQSGHSISWQWPNNSMKAPNRSWMTTCAPIPAHVSNKSRELWQRTDSSNTTTYQLCKCSTMADQTAWTHSMKLKASSQWYGLPTSSRDSIRSWIVISIGLRNQNLIQALNWTKSSR